MSLHNGNFRKSLSDFYVKPGDAKLIFKKLLNFEAFCQLQFISEPMSDGGVSETSCLK